MQSDLSTGPADHGELPNWREGPIITRDKDGSVRRQNVAYQTRGMPFGG